MAPRLARNLLLSCENQVGQKGWVAGRGVRQVYVVVGVVGFCGWWGDDGFGSVVTGRRSEGTDTRAEKELRIVRERVLDRFISARVLRYVWARQKGYHVLPLDC